MTPRLWRALSAPRVEHPLFRRVQTPADQRHWIGLWLVLGVGTSVLFLCSVVSTAFRWAAPALPLLPLALPLLVNLRAFGWSLDAADALAREQESATWDLLRLLPEGGLSSGWTLTCDSIARQTTFEFLVRLAPTVLAIGGAMVTVITLVAVVIFEPARYRALTADQLPGEWLIASVALVVLLYFDFTQTLVLAAVVGLYAGSSARTREDARALGAALFALIQFSVYLLVGVVGLALVPALFNRLGWTGLIPLLGTLLIRFALLCGTREVALIALWTRLTDQLGDGFAPQEG